jgi:hypothetical protein
MWQTPIFFFQNLVVEAIIINIVYIFITLPIMTITASTTKNLEKEKGAPTVFDQNN